MVLCKEPARRIGDNPQALIEDEDDTMVYLIHFDKPYKHARHYIGYTEDLEQRMHEHELGTKGARLLQVVRDAGINFKVVRTWPEGDRILERHLKKMKKSSAYCPVCRANGREERDGR